MTEMSNSAIGDILAELTTKVLESNIFRFNDEYYIQRHGTAMGSRMAPNFAAIFMHMFETVHLKSAGPHAPSSGTSALALEVPITRPVS